MKIGIRDGCLRESWETAFDTAAALGFDSVELDVGADYEQSVFWETGGAARLTEAAHKAGIELPTLCTGVCWTYSPASDDPEVRERISKVLASVCSLAAELGVQWVLVPVTPGEEGVSYETGTRRWLDAMADLGPLAADLGVVLCLENVGRGYGKSAVELAAMVDEVASPGVAVYYDIGNAVAFGNDPVHEISLLANRIAAVHIKDREADLLGKGIVPIPQCLQALRDIGYDDYLVLETPPTDDPRKAAAFNLAYLRGLL